MHRKTLVFLGDGMADEAIPQLGGKTPLEYAATPAMDSIARGGRSGTLLTLPDGFPTSSEVANMSILGCDLALEYCGRGPLEAAGRGIRLSPDDKAFRLNLTTVSDGILRDFSGGHIGQEDAEELVKALQNSFGRADVHFHPGVSYRNILVLSGGSFSDRVKTSKPDDHQGDPVEDWLPSAMEPDAEATAGFLAELIRESGAVLEAHPVNRRLASAGSPMANSVWPWSGGKAGALRTLREKYDITGAVISAVDVINGLGLSLGMDVISVPGATGYIDTNYEGKADAAVQALKTHDLVYVHVEAIDEVSHAQDLEKKLIAIEDFDSRVIARVLDAVGGEANAAVLPDHPVPIALGKHTRMPVPVSFRMEGMPPDDIAVFGESACLGGGLGKMRADDFMNLVARGIRG
jgi:2,3-bisphosphoglycerate-independent phosphoglycerate mutase